MYALTSLGLGDVGGEEVRVLLVLLAAVAVEVTERVDRRTEEARLREGLLPSGLSPLERVADEEQDADKDFAR